MHDDEWMALVFLFVGACLLAVGSATVLVAGLGGSQNVPGIASLSLGLGLASAARGYGALRSAS